MNIFVSSGMSILIKVVIMGGIVFGSFNLIFFILNSWLIFIISKLMIIVMNNLFVLRKLRLMVFFFIGV